MDIFICGNLKTYAQEIAQSLLDLGHTVVFSSPSQAIRKIAHKNLIPYDMAVGDDLYPKIFTSHSFDAMVHILDQPRESGLDADESEDLTNTAQLEAGLRFGRQTGINQCILISPLDAFNGSKTFPEIETLEPHSSIGQISANAEKLCQSFAEEDFKVSIIRVPTIYGFDEDYSILSKLVRQSGRKKTVEIPFPKLEHCNFLHSEDLVSLISKILEDEEQEPVQIFNLGKEDINYYFLSQQLNILFPEVAYTFLEDSDYEAKQGKIISENAGKKYDWHPRHDLISDLQVLTETLSARRKQKRSFRERLEALSPKLRHLLVWIEVLAGAFLMHMLTIWTSTIIEFKVVDYRLIYVVIIGSVHGLLFGIIAAVLAAASAVFSWNTIGLDFALLIYNVENWIPFAVYFLAGAVTGYVHDKQENDLRFEKQQTELIYEKYSFLYSLYNEISTIKNRLREQLVGYRDSFGRFFRITNELNELDEDHIFFKALEILEDLMKNDQIAIYSIESTGNFGRLQVASKKLVPNIPKSMRLDDYGEALPVLKTGEVFQNKDLLANYPAYIAPIMNGSQLIGLVIIWEADFDQFNMYYFNLFKVITGLVQSSLVRAATFENAQYEEIYLPGTRIMRPDSFKQTLAIHKKMRRNKVSAFQILRIQTNGDPWESVFERLSKGIRTEDIVGILDENSRECYILLANAGLENIGMIQKRMEKNGVMSEHMGDLELE